MQVTTIGLDLAKQIFQVHSVGPDGKAVLRKRLRRAEVRSLFAARLQPCLGFGRLQQGWGRSRRSANRGADHPATRFAALREHSMEPKAVLASRDAGRTATAADRRGGARHQHHRAA